MDCILEKETKYWLSWRGWVCLKWFSFLKITLWYLYIYIYCICIYSYIYIVTVAVLLNWNWARYSVWYSLECWSLDAQFIDTWLWLWHMIHNLFKSMGKQTMVLYFTKKTTCTIPAKWSGSRRVSVLVDVVSVSWMPDRSWGWYENMYLQPWRMNGSSLVPPEKKCGNPIVFNPERLVVSNFEPLQP